MFFSKKAKPTMDVEVLFGNECNLYGSHGQLIMDHKEKGLTRSYVRFFFKGLLNPPAMNPAILTYLFSSAEEKGYIPYELIKYGEVMECETVPVADTVTHNDTPVMTVVNANRFEYICCLQNGYGGTYQEWKNEKASSKVRENQERFERQLARQAESSGS